MNDKITIYSRKYRHFRGHKDHVNGKIKYHPNYVFGETKTKYYSYGITESKKYDKSHNNRQLFQNPNCDRKNEVSYIHKKPRSDLKKNYSSIYNNFNFHPIDKKRIDDDIDKKYKKKSPPRRR